MASKKAPENELVCCALCVCAVGPADKGSKYCSNTKSKHYEEIKTPAAHLCEKFIPKVKTN